MEVRELPIEDLVLDQALNLRDRLDEEAVERYAECWGAMPPVTVFAVDGRLLLADGFHRHAAAARRNRRTIAAEIRPGSYDEALEFAVGANLRHGLPMTRAERRRAVETKLRLHADWSDRRLAEELGVGRDLIARVRRQLVEAGQVPPLTDRVGSDGKTYSAGLPRDPNEHRPRDRAPAPADAPRDRGRRESDAAPWDDTTDPLPPVEGAPREGRPAPSPPWDTGDFHAVARSEPVAVAAPTIDEMLEMMARQVREVIGWTEADGFASAYRASGPAARRQFQDAAAALAECADRLRQG